MKFLFISLSLFVAGVMANAESLTLTKTIPLPGVNGRIDHFAIDPDGQRLFLAALGNNTVEVADLKLGQVVHSIAGLDEPQGIAYAAEFNALYVANGGDGSLRVYDGSTFAATATVKFTGDADNVRYDANEKRVYVGYGKGAIGIVDAREQKVVDDIPVGGHPESFQLEKAGPRLFVNVPGSRQIVVLNRERKGEIERWSLGFAVANFPMALDEKDRRLFVGCRLPARLLVFDLDSGKEIAKVDLHGDCDDVFYDPLRKQIYASCGEGFIDIFIQSDVDHYSLKEGVKTPPKARTCYYHQNTIYLAVPKRGSDSAEIRCYTLRG